MPGLRCARRFLEHVLVSFALGYLLLSEREGVGEEGGREGETDRQTDRQTDKQTEREREGEIGSGREGE